jgi:hypothetical protein
MRREASTLSNITEQTTRVAHVEMKFMLMVFDRCVDGGEKSGMRNNKRLARCMFM